MRLLLVFLIFMGSAHAELELSGTETRMEKEFKLAFKVDGIVSIKEITTKMAKAFLKSFESDELMFPDLVKRKYFIPGRFTSFVFVDYYFDNDKQILLNNNSVYRLRYRWNNVDKYYRYEFFPWLENYYPNRCEIQYKYDYQFNVSSGISTVQESRFEFRNESLPFSRKKDAPPPPWPKEIFLKYAKYGQYGPYKIQPSEEMEKNLGKTIKSLNLTPKYKLTTNRYRNHINIQHPWGSGPNPSQTFIVTLDQVSYEGIDNDREGSFLELEIEIERNASRDIYRLVDVENADKYPKEVKKFTQRAKDALVHDLTYFVDLVKSIFEKEKNLVKLPLMNKYKRAATQE